MRYSRSWNVDVKKQQQQQQHAESLLDATQSLESVAFS
jgi:hypothetical protein